MVKYLSRYSLVLSWTYLAYWKMHYSKTLSLVYLYNKQYHIWLLVHMELLFECSTWHLTSAAICHSFPALVRDQVEHSKRNSVSMHLCISNRIHKNMPAGFRGLAGDSKPRGEGSFVGLVQVNGPVHGLSAGGLEGASCQKQGAWEGVLHGHLPSIRLVNLSAK